MATEEIKSGNADDWINDYYMTIADELGLPPEERYFNIEESRNDPSESMVFDFIYDHRRDYELSDINDIETRIEAINDRMHSLKTQKGRPIENFFYVSPLFRLSFLIRGYKMIDAPEDILTRNPTNEEYRLIYEFLNFFKLIDPDKLLKTTTDKDKWKFLQSIYNYNKEKVEGKGVYSFILERYKKIYNNIQIQIGLAVDYALGK